MTSILKTTTLALGGLVTAALVAWSAPALASHGGDDPAGHQRHGHHGHHGQHHGHGERHHGHGADDPAGHDAGDDHGSGGHGADD
ncbi:hypothetical protein [Nocardioides sp.]|uniref:hypothetical protein n=1 Tax=Nocardioides sp. TaxID=35761 RepID=UPI0037841B50